MPPGGYLTGIERFLGAKLHKYFVMNSRIYAYEGGFIRMNRIPKKNSRTHRVALMADNAKLYIQDMSF
jgi:hypothetical protein